MLDVEEEPEVGKPYQGTALVKDIRTEVQSWSDTKTRTRKIITMENGIIYTLDIYQEKGQNEGKPARVPYHKPTTTNTNTSSSSTATSRNYKDRSDAASKSGDTTNTSNNNNMAQDDRKITKTDDDGRQNMTEGNNMSSLSDGKCTTNVKDTDKEAYDGGISSNDDYDLSGQNGAAAALAAIPLADPNVNDLDDYNYNYSTAKPSPATTPIKSNAKLKDDSIYERYNRSERSMPLSILVYSKDDPDLPSLSSDRVRGVWKYDEDSFKFAGGGGPGAGASTSAMLEDSFCWRPQEILLFKPGEDLDTLLTAEEDANGSSSIPTGVWGYPAGKEPKRDLNHNHDTDNHNNEKDGDDDDDDDCWWHPYEEALVVPPMVEIPDDFVPSGRYMYKPGSMHREWPPPVDKLKKKLHEVGKLNIPKCFASGKLPIKVFPKSRLPTGTKPEGSAKRGVSFAPVGHWAYPKGQEQDDEHFVPVDVDLYLGDAPIPDDGSMAGSWGYWGSSQGSVGMDDPDWEPEMSMVFPPGVEPDPNTVEIQGRWALPLFHNVKLDWPPAATQTARVYASKNAPPIEKGKTLGVWNFMGDRDEANEGNWRPQEVDLFGRDEVLERDLPNGLWGIRHGAEPDRDWNWNPVDVCFYPPGQDTGDDSWVQGKWALPVGSLKSNWPPVSKTAPQPESIVKLKIPKCFEGGRSVPINVYPRGKLPTETSPGKRVGSWAYPKHKEVDDDHYLPQTVELFLGNQMPPSASDDQSLPDFGVWALANDKGNDDLEDSGYLGGPDWSPNNSLVFPPGVEPDAGVRIRGKWSAPGRLKAEWPPSTSTKATVFPRKSLPSAEKGKTQGVWKFPKSEPENASKWKPQEVELIAPTEVVDDSVPNGSWGIKAGVKPDEDLKYQPKDVWFYPPGEKPETDCNVQGKWKGRRNLSWPPKVETQSSPKKSVGKLKIPGAFGSEIPGGDKSKGSVGKLKVPSLFSNS